MTTPPVLLDCPGVRRCLSNGDHGPFQSAGSFSILAKLDSSTNAGPATVRSIIEKGLSSLREETVPRIDRPLGDVMVTMTPIQHFNILRANETDGSSYISSDEMDNISSEPQFVGGDSGAEYSGATCGLAALAGTAIPGGGNCAVGDFVTLISSSASAPARSSSIVGPLSTHLSLSPLG